MNYLIINNVIFIYMSKYDAFLEFVKREQDRVSMLDDSDRIYHTEDGTFDLLSVIDGVIDGVNKINEDSEDLDVK